MALQGEDQKLRAKDFTTFRTTPINKTTTRFSAHTHTETMGVAAFAAARLIGSFHACFLKRQVATGHGILQKS